MNVVISGGGLAGLSSALRLHKVAGVKSITVLEKSSKNSFANGHLGLWTNALNVLRPALGESSFSALMSAKNCGFVQDSGYRDVKGEWLMKPKVGVSVYDDGKSPSLGFIRNETILSELQKTLLDSSVVLKYAETIATVESNSSSRSVIKTSSGEELPCDLLIAADGMNSHLLEMVSNQVADGKEMTAKIADRGYYVYRGFLSKRSLSSIPEGAIASSFQTWGAGGLRFAVVPASDGGISWFAAVTQIEQTNMRAYARKDKDRVREGPFTNESWVASSDDLVNLRSAFSDWHAPIPDLITLSLESRKGNDKSARKGNSMGGSSKKKGGINEADFVLEMERVSVCRAVASEGGPPKGSNGVFTLTTDDSTGTSTIAVASVGDAFFTFDPILAVGGGHAVVSADLLTKSLENHPEDIAKALQEYEKEGSTRAQVLSVISDIAQTMGSVKSPVIRAYINVVLTWMLPSAAKARGMDSLIRLTAGVP